MELFILGGLNLNEFEIEISLDSGLLQIRIKELYIVRYSWHFIFIWKFTFKWIYNLINYVNCAF